MSGYTKLFSSIIHSTVWQEDMPIKVVWITMLAMADQNGEVEASIPGLAKVAGVSIEQCEKALDKFMSPDPYSRTPDHEGRRIESIDGGWALLNHPRYRKLKSLAQIREKAAERQARYRAKKVTSPVTQSNDIAEAEANTEEKIKDNTSRKRSVKPKEQSLDEILKGGKGTDCWESFWKLAATFGPGKNRKPKTTAALWMAAISETPISRIQQSAELLRTSRKEQLYMPQLETWLENREYLHDLVSSSSSKSPQHRSSVDQAYLDQLQAEGRL